MIRVIHLIVARRRLMSPIVTRKEIIDSVTLGVTGGTVTTVTLATVVNDYTGTVGTCEVGNQIKGIYLFVQILPTVGTANVDWFVIRKPAGITNPVPGATGGTTTRQHILHEEKGIPGNAADGAYPLTFKGVIKIPRGKHSMREGDQIQLVLRGADVYNACAKCIYKVWK